MSKYSLIDREGSWVHLSSHAGDGVYGNSIYIRVNDIDVVDRKFVSNGLNSDNPDINPGVTIKPVVQTWGMKEFTVNDRS